MESLQQRLDFYYEMDNTKRTTQHNLIEGKKCKGIIDIE